LINRAVSFECLNVIGFASTTPHDWLKKLAPLFHPIRSKTKTNWDPFTLVFPHFASVTCNYFELWLVHWIVCVLCDWLEWLLWLELIGLLHDAIIFSVISYFKARESTNKDCCCCWWCYCYLEFLTLVKRDLSGKMGFNEFKELWAALNQWKVGQIERMYWVLFSETIAIKVEVTVKPSEAYPSRLHLMNWLFEYWICQSFQECNNELITGK